MPSDGSTTLESLRFIRHERPSNSALSCQSLPVHPLFMTHLVLFWLLSGRHTPGVYGALNPADPAPPAPSNSPATLPGPRPGRGAADTPTSHVALSTHALLSITRESQWRNQRGCKGQRRGQNEAFRLVLTKTCACCKPKSLPAVWQLAS